MMSGYSENQSPESGRPTVKGQTPCLDGCSTQTQQAAHYVESRNQEHSHGILLLYYILQSNTLMTPRVMSEYVRVEDIFVMHLYNRTDTA